MRVDEDVDTVDLLEAEPIDRAAELALIDPLRARPPEPLCRERNTPRLCRGLAAPVSNHDPCRCVARRCWRKQADDRAR